MKLFRQKSRAGFTLVEMMVSLGCGSLILAALMAGSVALQRSFAAVEGYSTTEGDQLRVLDYIAMDCRRALSATVANNGLTLTVPNYYDSSGNPVAPTFDTTTQRLQYNGGATTTISYSQIGSTFVRTVGSTSTAIATNVSSFIVTELGLNSTVSYKITFSPSFTLSPGDAQKAGTTVYSNTFLRNAGAR
jgi:Tfp pilus assembly protein PilW